MTAGVWREYVVYEVSNAADVKHFVDVLASNGDIMETVDAPDLPAQLKSVGYPFRWLGENDFDAECFITVAGTPPEVIAEGQRMGEASVIFLGWCETVVLPWSSLLPGARR